MLAPLVFPTGAVRLVYHHHLLHSSSSSRLTRRHRHHLSSVIADNAEVFKDLTGVKEYLEYVRGGGKYESRTIMSTLEYRDDTPDALEVSRFL